MISKENKSVMYFDWNVISSLANIEAEKNQLVKGRKEYFQKILNDGLAQDCVYIPYSKYHFMDILLSGNEKYYAQNLDALSKMTNNVEILENSSDNPFRITENNNINTEFEKFRELQKQNITYKVPRDLIYYFGLWEPDSVIKSIKPRIISFLSGDIHSENELLLGLFSIFRNELKEENERLPHISREEEDSENIQHLVIERFKESGISYVNFTVVFKLLQKYIHVTELTSDMIRLYCMAELLGIKKEKEDSSNQNLMNDIHHLNFGLHCHESATLN